MRVKLSSEEMATLKRLGDTVRLARLKRNLSQQEMAERMGVSRGSVVALESGHPGLALGHLAKTLTVFGYLEYLSELLASDPIGDSMDLAEGRQRAGARGNVADF